MQTFVLIEVTLHAADGASKPKNQVPSKQNVENSSAAYALCRMSTDCFLNIKEKKICLVLYEYVYAYSIKLSADTKVVVQLGHHTFSCT